MMGLKSSCNNFNFQFLEAFPCESRYAQGTISCHCHACHLQLTLDSLQMQGLTNVGSLPKRPFVGQKKPFSALGDPSPVASKKQKLTESFPEQSIEQLNDVTAVSGVNLREEEEKLLSMPKKENDAGGETRRLVREEEENLFLQKLPLQIKLAMIAIKCGIKNIGDDVERCLSLCMEERMRDLIGNLIRLSKQRVDVERLRHSVLVTSDVQRQIQLLNQKAKEGLEKKQCEEVVKPPKINKINASVSPVNPYEHHRMLANNAARVAFGGSDMQSKWQNMAARARRKSGGSRDIFPDMESSNFSVAATASASAPPSGSLAKVSHTISIKDVITALERDPQMSKSTLLYCLHEQMRKNTSA
ncbi:hypothetical protein Sjap_024247 [Stephania japonica]|uniref:Transcription initiation factor TFIID component TAF4 C-terminal domain-containing protein n=1 Tax=Stephania japonica TaxID=461633 RepID=A0AAP0EF65_9MAGN